MELVIFYSNLENHKYKQYFFLKSIQRYKFSYLLFSPGLFWRFYS